MKTPRKTKLTLAQFDYDLPPELISQQPIKPRDFARLLILDRESGRLSHRHFFDLPEILQPGDVLVFNDSKVIPARLPGKKETGGKLEIFLLKKLRKANGPNVWEVLVGGKAKAGQKILLGKKMEANLVKRVADNLWQAVFNCSDKKLFSLGETPLPPYIKSRAKLEDYQTIYAKRAGSVAAPTAGLHFTKRLLGRLKRRGVQLEYLTLHVGLGTFAPVKEEDILRHKMHSELAMIDPATVKRLNSAKRARRRIIAVGTTAARTLETFARVETGHAPSLLSGSKQTDIFIYPGYKFKFTDAIITNFHLPRSTLLMLISAFIEDLAGQSRKSRGGGIATVKKTYQEAIKKKYKFFSFGDSMLIR